VLKARLLFESGKRSSIIPLDVSRPSGESGDDPADDFPRFCDALAMDFTTEIGRVLSAAENGQRVIFFRGQALKFRSPDAEG